MASAERTPKGFTATVSWPQLAAFVLFAVMVAPALIGVGNLLARVGALETKVEKGILPNADRRISALEARTDATEKWLLRIEDKIDKALKSISRDGG